MSARDIAELIAVVGAIGLAALLLQPIATRLRLPDPLLFLALGLVIGGWSEAQVVITGDVLQIVGTVALVVILADGGLRCGFGAFRGSSGRCWRWAWWARCCRSRRSPSSPTS